MLNTLLIRVIGAGFAFLSLGLGRAYFDDVAFGTFAYVAQCITILVVFGQSGIEFLMFKSCSRGQLRVVFQIFYVFILSCLPVCIVTLLVVQMITGVPLGATLGIVTLVSALCIILTKCFANISLGFGQDTLYQIWDQGLRWAPLALVMLALLGLQHLSVTSSTVSTTFLLSTSGYLAITAVAVITSSLFRPRRVAFRGPRPRLVAHLFRRGLSFNAPSAMLFFLSVIDQFLLIRILEVGDYGVYRIAALAVTALAMVVDVLGLSIRRRFMAERDAQMRSFVFYELRARFRLLSLVGFIGGVGVLAIGHIVPYSEYFQLAGVMVIGHSIAISFGDPMFALKVSGKESAATLIAIAMLIVSPPLIWTLITAHGMLGAAIANGLVAVVTKLLLSTAAKRTGAI